MVNKCEITRFELGIISIAGGVFDFGRTQFNISRRRFLIDVSFKEVGSWHSDFGPNFTFFLTHSRKPEISQSQTNGLSEISLQANKEYVTMLNNIKYK